MPKSPLFGDRSMRELMTEILRVDSGSESGGEDEVVTGRMSGRNITYTRAELVSLSRSPYVKAPDGMPAFGEWYGEWRETQHQNHNPRGGANFQHNFNNGTGGMGIGIPMGQGMVGGEGRPRGMRGTNREGGGGSGRGGRGAGIDGEEGTVNSGRPRRGDAPYRTFTSTSPTHSSTNLPGEVADPKTIILGRKWEREQGGGGQRGKPEGGEEGEMGRFGFRKGKLALDEAGNRSNPRGARTTKDNGPSPTDLKEKDKNSILRSDGASDWRRGAGPSRLENGTAPTNSRWTERPGKGDVRHGSGQDEDRVPEWMMDDPAVAGLKASSGGNGGLRGEGGGGFGSRRKERVVDGDWDDGPVEKPGQVKKKGLEELQAQEDMIAKYRSEMKDKERRLRGDDKDQAPLLSDPAIAAQSATSPILSGSQPTPSSFLLPNAKARAAPTAAIPEAAPVAGGRGSRFAKFFDAPALSNDPHMMKAAGGALLNQAQGQGMMPPMGMSMSAGASPANEKGAYVPEGGGNQSQEKTQGLAALLGIKTPVPGAQGSAAPPPGMGMRQESVPAGLTGPMMNGGRGGGGGGGQQDDHMHRLLGMLKGANDGPTSSPPGMMSNDLGRGSPSGHLSAGGPPKDHTPSPVPPFQDTSRVPQGMPQSPARQRGDPMSHIGHGTAPSSPARTDNPQQHQYGGMDVGGPNGSAHQNGHQGQALLAQLQGGGMPPMQGPPYGGMMQKPMQDGYGQSAVDHHQHQQQQQLLSRMVDPQMQQRQMMGHMAMPGQQPGPMQGGPPGGMQKQMGFWQLANQLPPTNGGPPQMQQGPPPGPPQGQYMQGYPRPMPPMGMSPNGAPMPPYMGHQQGMPPFGAQPPPPGMMPGYMNARPPMQPPHMNPDLMALLGGMQARPQA